MPTVTRKPGPDAERLRIFVRDLTGLRGKVGWFETAHYPNGVPVAYVASIQEFGYPAGGIPPRLGLRATAREKTGEWREIAQRGAKAALKGTTTAYNAMELLGLKAAGDVRKHIAQVVSPPLKPATIQARLRKHANKSKVGNLTKPLVDSGEL